MFSQYVLILVWTGIVAVFAKYGQVNKKELIDGVEEERVKWLFALVAFLPVIFIAAYRPLDFGDSGAYFDKFVYSAPSSVDGISEYIDSQTKDKGFYVFMSLIKVFITKDGNMFFLILASIQGIILLSFYRYYSRDFVFSFFFFIASADYINWMFNGTRQFTAAVIIIAAAPLLMKKKYVPLILVILLASTFHQSALIMLPMIFVVQGEAWNKKTLVFIFLIILAIVFVGKFTGFMDDSLQDTQYSNVVSDYTSWGDDGTHPLRVLVYSVPTIIAIYGREKLKQQNNRLLNICINMSIISTGLYAVSMVTSGMFLGRLPLYFSLYNYVLLPWEIDLIFEEDMRKTVNLAAIVFYLAFYVYQVHFTWGLF